MAKSNREELQNGGSMWKDETGELERRAVGDKP